MDILNNLLNSRKKKIIFGIIVLCIIALIIFLATRKTPFEDTGRLVTPEPTIVAIENNTAEQADYTGMVTKDDGLFLNNKTVACADVTGGTLNVGITLNENVNGLILNPTYSKATVEHKYGYYITSKQLGGIRTSHTEYKDITDSEVANSSNVLIDWTYDQLMPANYTDENNYGVCWGVDLTNSGIDNDLIRIEVVDLVSHNITGSYTVKISKNAQSKYEISEIWNNDLAQIDINKVKDVWNLSSAGEEFNITDLSVQRNKLITEAQDMINSGNYISTSEQFNVKRAIVELTWTTNSIRYLSNAHTTEYRGNVAFPVWAVTLNSDNEDIGHITFYFYPTSDINMGIDYIYINTFDELKKYCKDI